MRGEEIRVGRIHRAEELRTNELRRVRDGIARSQYRDVFKIIYETASPLGGGKEAALYLGLNVGEGRGC